MTKKKPEKSKFKYIMKIIDRCIAFFLFLYLIILLFPYLFFSHKVEYKNLKIYSTNIIDKNISDILQRADTLLSVSGLYTTNIEHRIFLCNNYNLYNFFSPMARNSFACNNYIFGNIFIANCNINKDITFCNKSKNNKRSLSSVIAHEITHSLIKKYLGLIKNTLLPKWKNEGYCEFIAQESSIDETTGLEMFKKEQDDGSISFKYFEYRKVMEYLINNQKFSFDEIVVLTSKFNEVKIDAKSLFNK